MQSMTKTTIHSQSVFVHIFSAVMAKIHALLDSAAPVGYQDDAGFHLGVQRPGKS